MAKSRTKYRALERLSFRDERPDALPGEMVDLSHLSPDAVQMLLAIGAVEETNSIPATTPEED